jgi:arsenite/tail-anchored protein-transporting ATPase
MALFELSEFDRAGGFAHVVIDTAPTGHTRRLLELPHLFAGWITALDRMSEKHRYMVSQIARQRPREDAVDAFLADLSERLKRVERILHAGDRSTFLLVTIPEAMAVEETVRFYEILRNRNVAVSHLIINRVEETHGTCKYCAARTASQRRHLSRLQTRFVDVCRLSLPVMPQEVQGIAELRAFAARMWSSAKPEAGRIVKEPTPVSAPSGPAPLPAKPFVIIGGKGGVGKTTTAATFALQLAKRNQNQRFLVFSSDPAHSLSDCFGEQIGEFKCGISGVKNLDGIEINAVAKFESLKQRYRRLIEEMFASLAGGGWQVQFDREAMQELISLAPPGIDEIAALSAVSDFLQQGTYTSVILDTAPTGHLLRFLELPAVALEWARTFIRLLLKYREFVSSSEVAEELIKLSKDIKRVIATLTDPAQCEFIAVTIPERMSLLETERLIEGIERLHVSFAQVLINNVIPQPAAEGCGFCATRRSAQQHHLEEFRRRLTSAATILSAPQHRREVCGPHRLSSHFETWTVLPSGKKKKAVRGEA